MRSPLQTSLFLPVAVLVLGVGPASAQIPPSRAETGAQNVESIQVGGSARLVAYYPLDGNAEDLSGNGLHGRVYGAVLAADRFGVADRAYEFDGINDYIAVDDDSLLDLTEGVTVSLWLKPTAQTPDEKTVIEKSGPLGWGRYGLWCGTTARATFGVETSPVHPRIYSSSPLPVGEWTHLAGTCDGQYLRFYVNGELISLMKHTGRISVSDQRLYIGGDSYYDMAFFTGVIDEVRIYDGPLSEEEILALSEDGGTHRE